MPTESAVVVIGFLSGRVGGHATAGEVEVDVVERRGASGDGANVNRAVCQEVQHGSTGCAPQRDGDGATDDQKAVGGHPAAKQHLATGVGIVHPKLEHLVADHGQQIGRAVAGHEPAGVDDTEAVAKALGLIEVVRRHDDGDAGSFSRRVAMMSKRS